MNRYLLFTIAILSLTFVFASSVYDFEPLPSAVTDNAVAGVKGDTRFYIASMMGIGEKQTWNAVVSDTYILDSDKQEWSKSRDVPGIVGRIGAAAAGANKQIYLFGGSVLNINGRENPVPDVDGYDPMTRHWYRLKDLPIPVSYAVVGVYRDRYVYVIGGLSDHGPIKNVQLYDVTKNEWQQATPLSGPAVFGHAGAMAGDTLVYVDGVEPGSGTTPYVSSNQCWKGRVDRKNPSRIAWTSLPNHPGSARFGIEAAGYEKDHKVYFLGGSAEPHRYNGIGFDGKPVEPSPVAFDFDLKNNKWELISNNISHPRMDGGLLVTPDGLMLIGGMGKDRKLEASVPVVAKEPTASK